MRALLFVNKLLSILFLKRKNWITSSFLVSFILFLDPNLRIVFAIENSVRISYINSSRSILEKVFQTTEQTVGVTVDVKGGFVYWTAATEGKEAVHRTRADSNGPIEPIVDTGNAFLPFKKKERK